MDVEEEFVVIEGEFEVFDLMLLDCLCILLVSKMDVVDLDCVDQLCVVVVECEFEFFEISFVMCDGFFQVVCVIVVCFWLEEFE